jgi:hypothetical protein
VSSPQGYFVPAEWLAAITGKKLFYPCAGPDVLEPTEIFAPIVSELWYGDIAYPAGLRMDCVLGVSAGVKLTQVPFEI